MSEEEKNIKENNGKNSYTEIEMPKKKVMRITNIRKIEYPTKPHKNRKKKKFTKKGTQQRNEK